MYCNKKKAVATITTYSLILVLLVVIFLGSNYFYGLLKEQSDDEKKKQEVLYSLFSFRAELLNTIGYNNSNLSYQNNLDPDNLELSLSGTSIKGTLQSSFIVLEENISTLGVPFCSSYTFNPNFKTNFVYNGSCISKN